VAGQPVGITAAIEVFMVMPNGVENPNRDSALLSEGLIP
jgi:hypothetical protein